MSADTRTPRRGLTDTPTPRAAPDTVSAWESSTPTITAAEFGRIARILYTTAGIKLTPGKEELVKARLTRRLRQLGLRTFSDYLALVEQGPASEELSHMIDLLTTNKTSFFRENDHFTFLTDTILPAWMARGGPLRIWSAGCSTGEEPYTLAMTLAETVPSLMTRDVKLLATDISPTVLAQAAAGRYSSERLDGIPPELVRRYFHPAKDDSGDVIVENQLRRLITFARLNLMADWPMKGPFQAIFCRNVMIYFDKPTQRRLVERFAELLTPGGYLCCGHSESLTAVTDTLTYVQPAVYRKGG